MRILHIGKYYPPFAGGIEAFTADLCRAQARRGHLVMALVHGVPGDSPIPAQRDSGVRVVRVNTPFSLAFAPISPGWRRAMQRCIERFRPTVLHFHLPNPSALWAMTCPLAKRLPWVTHWHSDIVASSHEWRLRVLYPLYRPLERAFLRRSERIIATSPAYLRSSRPLKPFQHKAASIGLGIDGARLSSACKSGSSMWPGKGLKILSVGRFTYYKGICSLLQALSDVDDAQLIVAGRGPLEARYKAEIAQLGLEGRVIVANDVDDEQRNGLLASCDLVALPSVERTEAFGVVLLEAMVFGKPVLVSDIPGSGAPWLVRQSGHGWLAPPASPADWSRQLTIINQSPGEREARGRRGRAAYESQFEIGRIAAAVDRVYDSLG